MEPNDGAQVAAVEADDMDGTCLPSSVFVVLLVALSSVQKA